MIMKKKIIIRLAIRQTRPSCNIQQYSRNNFATDQTTMSALFSIDVVKFIKWKLQDVLILLSPKILFKHVKYL